MQICYPSGALRHDRALGEVTLEPGFDMASMALRLDLLDAGNGAVLRDVQGRERARGAPTTDTPLHLLRGDGGIIRVDRIEIGALAIVVASEALEPGRSYALVPDTPQAALRLGADGLDEHAALGAGAMVTTDEGALPVEWLRVGDRVLTRDNGFQPLRCVARVEFADRAAEAVPFWLPADAFGAHQPQRPLLVTPAQRVLLAAPELHLWFGESEMFARADALAETFGSMPASGEAPRLFALICSAQEVILADGLWLETALPTPDLLSALTAEARAILGDRPAAPARATLASWELAMFARPAIAEHRRVAA